MSDCNQDEQTSSFTWEQQEASWKGEDSVISWSTVRKGSLMSLKQEELQTHAANYEKDIPQIVSVFSLKSSVTDLIQDNENLNNSLGPGHLTESEKKSAESTYSCPQCGRGFETSFQLTEHQRLHTGERPYKCVRCGKMFCHQANFQMHLEKHKDEVMYKCTACGEIFQSLLLIEQHLPTHNIPELYRCNHCKMSFRYEEKYLRHLKRHENGKRYKCTTCDKGFKKYSYLKQHMTTHSREKPFKCSKCDMSFSKTDYLRNHQVVHMEDRPYCCPACKRTFKVPRQLKNHKCDPKKVLCKSCGRYFGSIELFEKHKIENDCNGQKMSRLNSQTRAVVEKDSKVNDQKRLSENKVLPLGNGLALEEKISAEDQKERIIQSEEKPKSCDEDQLRCVDCGRYFEDAALLHEHYMLHARGEV